jgi:hypothetical protein
MSNTKGYVDRSGIYRRIRNIPYHIRQDGYFYSDSRTGDELEFQHYEEQKNGVEK